MATVVALQQRVAQRAATVVVEAVVALPLQGVVAAEADPLALAVMAVVATADQ